MGILDFGDVEALAGNKRHRQRIRAMIKVKKPDYVLVKEIGGGDKGTHCQILTLLDKILYSMGRDAAGG